MKKRIRDLESFLCEDPTSLSSESHRIEPDLDFSMLTNPLGNPFDLSDSGIDLSKATKNVFERLTQYPDNRYSELRASIASFLGNTIIPEQVIPGNGSCELLKLVLECTVDEGDKVVIVQPAMDLFEKYCSIHGAEIMHLMGEDLRDINDSLLKDTKIVFLSNPSDVSGKLMETAKLNKLSELCSQNGTLLFVNESCIDFADNSASVISLTNSSNHLFVLRSFETVFAIPGIRIGFGLTSPKMAEKLNSARLSWNLGVVSEKAAISLMKRDDLSNNYLAKSREYISENREYLATRLDKIRKFNVLPGDAHYVLVDVSASSIDSTELTNRLLNAGIKVMDCSCFYSMGKDFIRVSVRSKEDTDSLVREIGVAVVDSARDKAMRELEASLLSPDFSATGPNKECPYYPCHFQGQDCTFCFCPFYPCGDERTGGKWVERSSGGKVWSCEKCDIVHHLETAEKLVFELKGDSPMEEKLKKAWKKVVDPLL
ncbi:threonine-phosphate decarboxylase [Methanohalophilus levihalophilus]|uniref:aminotransferase class I/II-fold pyridoxal phosphate-dependent enzyme n=1 Tax=Methanohalophilus levihalophilus TaxID=1431282 RepID=UPI001AE0FBCC|nr:aminotransferase class I/II-fold pyridoxal phosphate-dependent enzyme [Methanohalophilus levihalophilus]MBP2030183.1 threonine-phosphate decarboxylase [Methanohalophilus levihalophilus]